MSKKSRKARTRIKRVTNYQPSTGKTAQSMAQVEGKKPIAKQVQNLVPAPNILQAGQYDYVKRDLINIGIVISILVLILIVLTFVPGLKT